MTDKEKLEKVRAEIERHYNYHKDHADDWAGTEHFWKADEDRKLLSFIDSMQEEPKECMYSKDNYTDEDRKVLCDGCEEESCKYSKLNTMLNGALSKETKESWNKQLKEETKDTVNEDLEEAVNAYIGYAPEVDESSSTYGKRQAFKAGANWQKQQLMAKAVDGFVIEDIEEGNGDFLLSAEYLSKDMGLKDRQKVKVIVIKETEL